jgi:hypothetical protein
VDIEMIRGAISLRSCLMALSLLVCASLPARGADGAAAQAFSADIVTRRDDASVRVGRLSVLGGKVRIETSEFPDSFFLVDTAQPSAYFVRPAAHVYMEARQSSRLTRLFVPVDPDAPCRQWQVMARLAGASGEGEWRCERTGEATIDGQGTVAFQVVTEAGQAYLAWIDPIRKFPLRIKGEDGVVMALENLRDQPQAASSFELPTNSRKFSPEALVERIKQSDVWVSAPEDREPSRR